MAHKKAGWSAKNLRDSKPKYRWVKVFGWQKATAGNIIIRQKW
jgi:large subunit ribosomal protein L27